VKLLSTEWLLKYAFVIAEDLYKQGNTISVFTEQHEHYVKATAGVFFERFREDGYVLSYTIDNSFEETALGMQRPLYLFRRLFEAAGFVYICPATISLGLMKEAGIPASKFLDNYRPYEAEGRHVATLCIKGCKERRKSYVALEIEANKEFLLESWETFDTSAVKIYRHDAPIKGSKAMVDWPKSPELT
jgi:hypothetical protein